MNHYKRLLSILLVAVMTIMATSCGAGESAASPSASDGTESVAAESSASTDSASSETTQAPPEPVTITWFGGMYSRDLTDAIPNNPVFNKIVERTGVTMDFTPSMGVNDINEKLAIMLAANDLPDVVTFGGGELITKVLAAKAAIPLDDLVKANAPNLVKNASRGLAISKMAKSDDTHALYMIPGDVNGVSADEWYIADGWFLRWDLYKKLNYPALEKTDDLLAVMKQMMDLEPTNKDGKKNYGLGLFLAESWGNLMLDKPFAFFEGIVPPGQLAMNIDVRTNKVSSRLTDPNSPFLKEMAFFNKAYRMGILDPESATLKFEQFLEKAKTGRYHVAVAQWLIGDAEKQFAADGAPEKGYVPMLFDYAKDGNLYLADLNDGGNQYATFITENCKTPERAVQLIDFLCTPEGVALQKYGVEGEHWTIDGEYLKQNQEVLDSLKNDPEYGKKTGIGIGYNMNFLNYRGLKDQRGFMIARNPETMLDNITLFAKDYMDHYGYKTLTEGFFKAAKNDNAAYPMALPASLKMEPGSDLAATETQLNAYVETSYATLVFQKSEEDFNAALAKFVDKCNSLGAQDVVNEYAKQYEKYLSEVESYATEMSK